MKREDEVEKFVWEHGWCVCWMKWSRGEQDEAVAEQRV